MPLPIQLISTDFDGTLHADFESPPVPEDLQALIGDLQQKGAHWVINTGRDISSVMEGIARARLSIKPDYLVVVERHIYKLEGSHYTAVETWNQQCEEAHAELFARVRQDVRQLVEWIDDRFKATLYEDDYSPFCLIADSNDSATAIHSFLEAYCKNVAGLTVVRNDIYARFSHMDYNKGTALREIARQLEIPTDQILAAGDHLNDLPMLSSQVARYLVAPDNAVPEVKEKVLSQNGYVSHQPWGHGVARGLEHFLQQQA